MKHAAIYNQVELAPVYVDAEELKNEDQLKHALDGVQGILVPGGFGERGTEGKIKAIEFARKNKIPFFGICLGMQLAMVEFARHVVGLGKATSEEFTDSGDLIIHYMKGQHKEGSKGASMRLGSYDCKLMEGSLAYKIYGKKEIAERHRHRLEVNNKYVNSLKNAGMVISGVNEENNLVEVVEITDHPFFIGCQFHPEFKSRPYSPHPIFRDFIKASGERTLS